MQSTIKLLKYGSKDTKLVSQLIILIPTSYFLLGLGSQGPYSWNTPPHFLIYSNNEIYPPNFVDRYNHNDGEEGGFKQAGYNPNHQSTRVERVNLKSETITLKP